MDNITDIEKSIICTLLTSYNISDNLYSALMGIDVKDDYFTVEFYKTIIRAINWLKSNNKCVSDEIVSHYLFLYNKMDENLMIDILTHNCLGIRLFNDYLELLKSESKLNAVRDI